VYYESKQKLAHGLQTPSTYSFFTTTFWARGKIIVLYEDYNYKNGMNHVIVA
jgi:hypothetical protein